MHAAAAWGFFAFGTSDDPLAHLPESMQRDYVRCYLDDLDAAWILEEPHYFDQDYLAEFSAFYSQSAPGYRNNCRRLLVFDKSVKDLPNTIDQALRTEHSAIAELQSAFLGFIILRPIPTAPLGRTVLRWYPESTIKPARIVTPSREYCVHLAGLRLTVHGLAWQQQDAGVSACATIALWSMLHSRAFHEQHTMPTTVAITLAAHRKSPWGFRTFPSDGLIPYQLLEALKELGFGPIAMQGDLDLNPGKNDPLFSKERFCASLAAAIRSGYPVLLLGRRDDEGHAVCAVGFREASGGLPPSGTRALADREFDAVYIHDDNLGPSVRFEVRVALSGAVELVAAAAKPLRPRRFPNPTDQVSPFIPEGMIIAVHADVRTEPDEVHTRSLEVAKVFARDIADLEKGLAASGEAVPSSGQLGVETSIRFFKLREYLNDALPTAVGDPVVAGKARRALCETAPPMSLHIAVARLFVAARPCLDILFDTTDSRLGDHAFAYVTYAQLGEEIVRQRGLCLGVHVRAY